MCFNIKKIFNLFQIKLNKNLSNELEDYKSFKIELEPQLENAHQEIAMNKSMLEMLNNEIKLLNSEKLQLEKKA